MTSSEHDAIEDARADLMDAADAMTADEVHQHPFAALVGYASSRGRKKTNG